MMSASAMSAMIRAKKKKMEDDREAVKLSGIPEDATDIMVVKNHEAGEMLSDNKPMERDEEPSLESEMAQEKKAAPHEESAPGDDEDLRLQKHLKIKKMLSRMAG